MQRKPGLFVAVDGPKYAGKTVVLEMLGDLLLREGVSANFSKEPTTNFALSQEQICTGIDLAHLLTEDRRRHVAEIMSMLAEYDVVVTDRYIASSLVFQVIDGVPFDTVVRLNSEFPLPGLNIFLVADQESLMARRKSRDHRTRLELATSLSDELELYAKAAKYLKKSGVTVLTIDNSNTSSPEVSAQKMTDAILAARARAQG